MPPDLRRDPRSHTEGVIAHQGADGQEATASDFASLWAPQVEAILIRGLLLVYAPTCERNSCSEQGGFVELILWKLPRPSGDALLDDFMRDVRAMERLR